MSGRIITARHGRPDVDRTVSISAKEYGTWWADYDLAGLAKDQSPPDSLCQVAADAETVWSSTLPRAIETAAWVTGGSRDVPQDPLFVEAPLPAPPVPLLKTNPVHWGRISRAFWFLGYAPNGVENHLAANRRVQLIIDRLIDQAATGGDVLLCAHGYLNWMIDGQIRRRGWARIAHQGGNDYWSWRAYLPKGQTEGRVIPTPSGPKTSAPAVKMVERAEERRDMRHV